MVWTKIIRYKTDKECVKNCIPTNNIIKCVESQEREAVLYYYNAILYEPLRYTLNIKELTIQPLGIWMEFTSQSV